MNKTIIWGVGILLTAMNLSCCKQIDSIDSLMTIDVKASYPEKELNIQDVMDVEYIPLETSDEFLTQGLVKAVSKHYLFITNRINDGTIFIFDRKSGKGIRKINRKGQGAEEYTHINSIIFDEETQELFINSSSSKKIHVYDLNGKHIRTLPVHPDAIYMELYDFDKNQLIGYDMSSFHKNGEERDKPYYHVLISKQDGHITRGIPIPFSHIQSPFIRNGNAVFMGYMRSISYNQNTWYLTDCSSDTVYRYAFDANKLIPVLAKAPTNNPVVFLCVNLETENYLFLEIMENSFDTEKRRGFVSHPLLYDRQNKKLCSPIIKNRDYRYKNIGLVPNTGNKDTPIAKSFSADELLEALENNELQGELKEIATNLKEEDNPVILLIKHKK